MPDLTAWCHTICAHARIKDLSESQATADGVIAANAAAIDAECVSQWNAALSANGGQVSPLVVTTVRDAMWSYAKTL